MIQQNITIKLLRIIGSPFQNDSQQYKEFNYREIELLYNHAFKNRVELLFFDKIRSLGLPTEMKGIYKDLLKRHNLTKSVAAKASAILQDANIPHVIFKSMKPYPATPNDTDILCFDPRNNYNKGLEALLKAGYMILGQAPLQICLSDPRGKGKVNLQKKGGIYYLDYYKEIGADYLVYINQTSLVPFIKKGKIDGNSVFLLGKEPELAIVLFHNVFPERTFNLEHFYTSLYRFNDPTFSFNIFKKFVNKNRLSHAIKSNLSLIIYLHKLAFHTIPQSLAHLLDFWGENNPECIRLAKMGSHVPYNFSPNLFWKTFAYKLQDVRTLESLSNQVFNMIIDPYFFLEVIKSIKRRTFFDAGYLHQ